MMAQVRQRPNAAKESLDCVSEMKTMSPSTSPSTDATAASPAAIDDQKSSPISAGPSSGEGTLTATANSDNLERVRVPGRRSSPRKARPSMFDVVADSEIAQSEFWGFLNLLFVAVFAYSVTYPIIRYLDKGTFIDPTLAKLMFQDFFMLMLIWFICCTYSFLPYYVHLAYRRKALGKVAVRVIQHSSQTFVFVLSVSSCLYLDAALLPCTFILIVGSISFMKMHSFTEVTLQMHEAEGTKSANADYPACLTPRNYLDYLFCPVLIYETSYPRGDGFRVGYFVKKILALVGAFVLLYLLLTGYVLPTTLMAKDLSYIETFLRLVMPVLAVDFLAFFILFECICNLLAEITNFADREFYRDWWNSTNWDEYARDWNRPVHEFLLKHVYLDVLDKGGSQTQAVLSTFMFSAAVHEMIMSVCLRMVRFYLFLLMMTQLPLMHVMTFVKKHFGKRWGNAAFWLGVSLGVPALVTVYSKAWADLQTAPATDIRRFRLL